MRLIAIDLGATYIKGGLLDLQRHSIAHVQRTPFPSFLTGLEPSFREVDAGEIVARVEGEVRRLLRLEPTCAGLVLCSQMHGLVLVNEKQEPLSNFISWQDQRTLQPHPSGEGTYFDVLCARLSEQERTELGNELRPGYALTTLFWLSQQGRLSAPAEGRKIIPASLPDFVVARLSGVAVPTEPTLAAAHGCYDLRHRRWHTGVIAKLGLSALDWPEVVATGEVACRAQLEGQTLPIYTPVGDQQAALAGAGLEEGELSLNIATGSQVSRVNARLEFGRYQVRPYFDGRYLNTITHIPAGRALNLLVKLLGEVGQAQGVDVAALKDPWEAITAAAQFAGPTDLKVDLSFFPSATGTRGGITNISEANLNLGHLFRAAFQNMADNYATLAQGLAGPTRKWKRLVFSGGIAQKNALLRELICAKFDSPHRICASSEDTLWGLLGLSLVFTRQATSLAEASGRLRERPGP